VRKDIRGLISEFKFDLKLESVGDFVTVSEFWFLVAVRFGFKIGVGIKDLG